MLNIFPLRFECIFTNQFRTICIKPVCTVKFCPAFHCEVSFLCLSSQFFFDSPTLFIINLNVNHKGNQSLCSFGGFPFYRFAAFLPPFPALSQLPLIAPRLPMPSTAEPSLSVPSTAESSLSVPAPTRRPPPLAPPSRRCPPAQSLGVRLARAAGRTSPASGSPWYERELPGHRTQGRGSPPSVINAPPLFVIV